MKKFTVIALSVLACLLLLSGCSSNGGSEKVYSATCQVCGRTFSYTGIEYGSSAQKNASNIARTNMCINCYNNYKYLKGY